MDKKQSKELLQCKEGIVREIAQWNAINKRGCNDPFWADGINMNLTRNHILSYKTRIREICFENNLSLPEEYYLPTPQEVDNNYMANLEQKERVKRLKQNGIKITTSKNEYDAEQLSLF